MLSAIKTLSIRFWCRASRQGNDGKSPVELVINLDGERLVTILPRRENSNSYIQLINARRTNPLREYLNAIESRIREYETSCLREGKPITITNPEMTRFMMTLDDAVDLVLYAFEHGEQGDLFVQKAPAATIDVLAKAVINLTGSKTGISYIGTRHGEKLYETLVTQEEMIRAEDMGNFFRVAADNRNLNYDKYFTKGNKKLNLGESYTSHNTGRLDVAGMEKLLKKLELFGGPVKQHE